MDAQLFNLMIIIIIYITTLIFQVLFIIIIITIILIIILIVSCVRVSLSNGYFDSIPLHSKYKFNIVHVASFFLSFLFSAPFDSNHHHSTRISSSLQLKVCIIIITPLLSSSLSQQLLINCSSINLRRMRQTEANNYLLYTISSPNSLTFNPPHPFQTQSIDITYITHTHLRVIIIACPPHPLFISLEHDRHLSSSSHNHPLQFELQ